MNPFNKFNKWFNLAKKTFEFDPTAFALSSSSKNKTRCQNGFVKKDFTRWLYFFY